MLYSISLAACIKNFMIGNMYPSAFILFVRILDDCTPSKPHAMLCGMLVPLQTASYKRPSTHVLRMEVDDETTALF